MIVPIAVLNASEDFPAGWVEAAVDLPSWWDVAGIAAGVEQAPVQKLKPQRRKEKPPGLLFPIDEEQAQQEPSPAAVPPIPTKVPDWIASLLSSAVFEEQKRLG
jgi:hypothetical protein